MVYESVFENKTDVMTPTKTHIILTYVGYIDTAR